MVESFRFLVGWAGWALVTWLPISPSHHGYPTGKPLPRGVKLTGSICFLVQLCFQSRGLGQGCRVSQHLCPRQACGPVPSRVPWEWPWNCRAGHTHMESRGVQVEVLWLGSVSGNLTEKEAEGGMPLLTSRKERKDELTLTPVLVLWSLFFKLIKNTNKNVRLFTAMTFAHIAFNHYILLSQVPVIISDKLPYLQRKS